MPMQELEPLLETMRGIAAKYDVPVSAVALNWVICKGAIPLGGAKTREQAEQVGCRDGLCFAGVGADDLAPDRTPRP